MTKILYYTLILPTSLLPYSLLYLLSDILYLFMYKVMGYRKKVVFTNLKNSFPDKNEDELKTIMSNFYKHLCDIILEGIKGFTITEKELRERMVFKNPEFANEFAKKKQSIILVGGHYNNWEMAAQSFCIPSNHKCIGIYKPLNNSFMNNKIYKSRSKYGMNLISMKKTKTSFEEGSQAKAIVFGSDQNPANPKSAHWVTFLNQDTAVLFGAEKYAKKYNWPVIFVSINKVKRGYYEVTYSLITEKPNEETHGEITEKFTKRLEEDILKQPEYWLWSHKRWKHKR